MTKRIVRRPQEKGAATILVLIALSLFLIAAVGLAIDGSQLYAHRQMLQAAADSAAQAAVMSVFDKTNTGTNNFGGSAFTCTVTDVYTPCYYIRQNGVGTTAADKVDVDFPTVAPGVNLSGTDTPNMVRVTVTRSVQTGFIRMVAPAVTSVRASAIAAIVDVVSPTPILVTHPSSTQSLSVGGNGAIQICGGPRRSIQINSTSTTALSVSGSGSIDLHRAGPPDTGTCTTGTGGDIGTFGGPATVPGGITLGSGRYIQPSSPILDPLASVPAPALPAAAPAKANLGNGVCGCSSSNCQLYSPGSYPTGITIKNETAVFKPGIYYMQTKGFSSQANGDAKMATVGCNPGSGVITASGATGNGMVVYITGSGSNDVLDLGANSNITLLGDTLGTTYKNMLFFGDRTITAQKQHSVGGGGSMSLTGTIYLTNTLATMQANANNFQMLSLGGNGGGMTTVRGQIITGKLALGGTGGIIMALNPASTLHIRQVALIQ
jgi:hypothetical protein